ncbi:phosphoribosyl transferase domain protein [Coniochaeta sp. 2T2.1]|nr:phosphoribosyl transferase domain protein [Coniochaeta sp. 2T2.1]
MATLTALKDALRKEPSTHPSSPKTPLTDAQYAAGYEIITSGAGQDIYNSFIIPQLSALIGRIISSHGYISVLEVGPGPKSVLGELPFEQRRRFKRYVALEPNRLFADSLKEWMRPARERDDGTGEKTPFWLITDNEVWKGKGPEVRTARLELEEEDDAMGEEEGNDEEKFDVIIFCHSMYGMKPEREYMERALGMLDEDGVVIVFHRDGLVLDFDTLVCSRTASYPTGRVSVADDPRALDDFAAFIAGYQPPHDLVRVEWRNICRNLGRRGGTDLTFSSPELMVTFTQQAIWLNQLADAVKLSTEALAGRVKNWEGRSRRWPASLACPRKISHVQECVRWAVKHGVGLTVLGGGHGAYCAVTDVVAVDMSALDDIRHYPIVDGTVLVAEAGCRTENIIKYAQVAGLTVPLGSRPSVGAGLWLQGGIGHLSRLYGLSCDSIVGAVLVSLVDGSVLYVGEVPPQHRPADAVRAENEKDILWAIKGAGTNFGIVISVTFKAYPAPTLAVSNWITALSDKRQARLKLNDLDTLVARELPRNHSADGYLFCENGQMHLGVTLYEAAGNKSELDCMSSGRTLVRKVFARLEDSCQYVDGVGLFIAEMYMSMHGRNGGGKTSSFKRCVFLKNISEPKIMEVLFKALETRPTPLCYIHLLHSGGTGAVADVPAHGTAFGCRDWDYACVITGVWARDQDDTPTCRAAVEWVYDIVGDLLPLSQGVYGADLGPDPRDAPLAAKAFGPNRPRLARLKQMMDPHNILRYACPLPEKPMDPKLIILVTGEHGVGKDYFAKICESQLGELGEGKLRVRTVSISYALKRKYAAEGYADLNRLLSDREYKEEHRTSLRKFYNEKCRQRPGLPEEHFLDVVYGVEDVDVLVITGMRDEAPVAAFGHLVPDSRLIEIRVTASEETRRARRKLKGGDEQGHADEKPLSMDYRPTFTFDNDEDGNKNQNLKLKKFVRNLHEIHFGEHVEMLSGLVRSVPDYPRRGITFRHVLGMFEVDNSHDILGDIMSKAVIDFADSPWDVAHGPHWRIQTSPLVVGVEWGGSFFAGGLVEYYANSRAVLIRGAGKVPPPRFSVVKKRSRISGATTPPGEAKEERFEIGRDAIRPGQNVLVVDDVLASGETLCAVLELLGKAGVEAGRVSVVVVAEFPLHRGRELLRRRGFGGINVHSVLTYGGA